LIASLPLHQRQAWLKSLTEAELSALEYDWKFWARFDQLAPAGAWGIWLALAGRGWGKTRVGAEWVCQVAREGPLRIALLAPTEKDVIKVMVEGDSGILACSPPWNRPTWVKNELTLTWPNGAQAFGYSADVPRSLRGPQHHAGWCDELGAWRRMREAWDMYRMGLRLGNKLRTVITTTPTPSKLIQELVADKRKGPDGGALVRTVRGSTYANAANLGAEFLEDLKQKYEGTRLGRQELHAEILTDKPGALWTLTKIEALRWSKVDADGHQVEPEWRRKVVAIDPPVTSGANADECGIIVAGLGADGHGYVIEDASERGLSPKQWADKAVEAYHRHGCDRVVAETNQGGEMIETIMRGIDPNISYTGVHAKDGKYLRAEPISSLYEQGRVHHMGVFKALEDQMCDFTSDFDKAKAGYSPDRLDALVYALKNLMLKAQAGQPGIRSL
jgi:phage terminase large subunit-like protein